MHGGPPRHARNATMYLICDLTAGASRARRNRTARKKGREVDGQGSRKKGFKIIFTINAVNASARCYQNQSYQKVSLSLSRW